MAVRNRFLPYGTFVPPNFRQLSYDADTFLLDGGSVYKYYQYPFVLESQIISKS